MRLPASVARRSAWVETACRCGPTPRPSIPNTRPVDGATTHCSGAAQKSLVTSCRAWGRSSLRCLLSSTGLASKRHHSMTYELAVDATALTAIDFHVHVEVDASGRQSLP